MTASQAISNRLRRGPGAADVRGPTTQIRNRPRHLRLNAGHHLAPGLDGLPLARHIVMAVCGHVRPQWYTSDSGTNGNSTSVTDHGAEGLCRFAHNHNEPLMARANPSRRSSLDRRRARGKLSLSRRFGQIHGNIEQENGAAPSGVAQAEYVVASPTHAPVRWRLEHHPPNRLPPTMCSENRRPAGFPQLTSR